MKVDLVSYTPNALELLLYTKNTRLQGQQTLQDIIDWVEIDKLEHLAYMRDTIKSSWEFVDYVFEIQDVTRAFTHQLVRSRQASYAQQSQRAVNVSESTWENPVESKYSEDAIGEFESAMVGSMNTYKTLIDEHDMEVQDARGVLPTNIHTSIIMKVDLRTLHTMAEVRLCTKAQGEYQTVFRAMKAAVVAVHPWADDFLQVFCANHGSCCFPRFDACPIQKHTYTAQGTFHQSVKNKIRIAHDELVGDKAFAANPIVKGGRADGK